MSDVANSESSDDEEYVPENVDESSESSNEGSADEIDLPAVQTCNKEIQLEKAIKNDKIWEEFINDSSLTKSLKTLSDNTLTQPKKPNEKNSITKDISTAESRCSFKRPSSTSDDRLSLALKKLKSSSGIGAAPKISTLEKSKQDWESFVEKEDIADELKIFNRGKGGYLERKAFEARTSQREYLISREARLKDQRR